MLVNPFGNWMFSLSAVTFTFVLVRLKKSDLPLERDRSFKLPCWHLLLSKRFAIFYLRQSRHDSRMCCGKIYWSAVGWRGPKPLLVDGHDCGTRKPREAATISVGTSIMLNKIMEWSRPPTLCQDPVAENVRISDVSRKCGRLKVDGGQKSADNRVDEVLLLDSKTVKKEITIQPFIEGPADMFCIIRSKKFVRKL